MMRKRLALPQPKPPARTPLYDTVRNHGLHLQAARGAGKSTLEATIALADAARHKPVVLFEVQGGLVEQLLWRLRWLEPDTRQSILSRLVYVDMSGKRGRITPWPLLYQLPGDSLYTVARRFIELQKRLDPDLTNAPILGANALDYLGTYTGMALYAMGCQYTEATALLDNPLRWKERLRQAGQRHAEAEPATSFFLNDYANLSEHDRRSLTITLKSKLAPFSLDPTLKAMFGAASPGIDWAQVSQEAQLVILDFQDVEDEEVPFRMRWAFACLWSYLKRRENPRENPISIILDELSYMLSMKTGSDDLLAADLDNFINKDMRYRNIWLTVAHQELYQVPERIRKTLMSMGTQLIGQTSDKDAADSLAAMYLHYDPYRVKKRIPRWAVMTDTVTHWYPDYRGTHHPFNVSNQRVKVIDYVTEEFTLEEQREQLARQFLSLTPFTFLLSQAQRGAHTLKKVSILPQVRAIPVPNPQLVNEDRQWLIERSGTPIVSLHEAIRQRQLSASSTPVRRSG